MKKLYCIVLLCLVFPVVQGQKVFNPDAAATPPGKLNFREFSGFSYEVMAGFFIPPNSIFYSFGFYPRYNFIAPKDWVSLSIGSPSNFGFDFAAGSNGTLFRYMIDIPLTLDFNIGARATSLSESPFGIFLGAGMDYNFMHITYNDTKFDINTFGPVVHGGMRWTMNGRPSGIRLSYLSGLSFNGAIGAKIFAFSFIYGI